MGASSAVRAQARPKSTSLTWPLASSITFSTYMIYACTTKARIIFTLSILCHYVSLCSLLVAFYFYISITNPSF